MQARAKLTYLLTQLHLKNLVLHSAVIGDVRGRGLMLGVELVTDRQSKTPAKVEILRVMEQMKGIFFVFVYALVNKFLFI